MISFSISNAYSWRLDFTEYLMPQDARCCFDYDVSFFAKLEQVIAVVALEPFDGKQCLLYFVP